LLCEPRQAREGAAVADSIVCRRSPGCFLIILEKKIPHKKKRLLKIMIEKL